MEVPVGKLKLSEVPVKPWTHLMVDFIMKLPLVAGKDAILVVYDRLSKMTYFVATTEETSVEGLASVKIEECEPSFLSHFIFLSSYFSFFYF